MSTLATTALATATAVIGAAAMYLPAHLRLLDARAYRAAADDTFSQAERLAAEVDRTRNLPWYWPTGPAVEAAKLHEAEVLHVTYPTQELRLVEGLAALADEVGLVQATTDQPEHTPSCPDLYYCPTVDEVESGCHGGFDVCCVSPELHQPIVELRAMPALSDRPAEDEDEVGDEQPGEALADTPASLRARFRGWRREQWATFRELCRFRSQVPVNPPYHGRHWVSDVQHTGAWPLVVPKQRTGGDDL